MGRRRGFRVVAAAIFLVGSWFIGSALWIEAKAWAAQLLLERAWTAAEAGDEEPRPWPWADTWPVARLSAPELGVERMVLAGASGRTLAFGPAELQGLEGSGVTILSGHRDTHFAFLRHLGTGMELHLERPDGGIRLYRVVGSEIIDARSAVLHPSAESSRPHLALVTCWPFDAIDPHTPWRYVVSAIPMDDGASQSAKDVKESPNSLLDWEEPKPAAADG